MTNRIVDVNLTVHRLDAAEAEVWVEVAAKHVGATTQIRGRLVGPKSAHTTTIEVAYPLRPFAHKPATIGELAARVVIPEPSPWTPPAHHTYDAFVELWEGGARCDQRRIDGFRLVNVK